MMISRSRRIAGIGAKRTSRIEITPMTRKRSRLRAEEVCLSIVWPWPFARLRLRLALALDREVDVGDRPGSSTPSRIGWLPDQGLAG